MGKFRWLIQSYRKGRKASRGLLGLFKRSQKPKRKKEENPLDDILREIESRERRD